ncbi:MAG: malto-oligosyltrehalose trehalohydrolase [Actinomycetes bacterium]
MTPSTTTPTPLHVWAPAPATVSLVVGPPGADPLTVPMARDEDGWWRPAEALPAELESGEVDYGFLLDDADPPLPDPRSRRQPYGVHGLSRSFDPVAYAWGDEAWTGRQLAGGVIYEMHVGTFTPEGTLDAAIQRLDHLVELGVDFVEIMPVNAFNGTHGWGYDGVLWFAVHEPYGGPAAYQRFVDACHQRGLGVLQDVVYNHLGPSGNYLPRYGPYLDSGRSNTWGDSVNLDGAESEEVRRLIIDNALMWLRDYHVDGLRLDAVHALRDSRAIHLLEELAVEVDALSAFLRRPLTLIAESDLNDPRLITPREAGGYGLAGQWSDDLHHALYANLTGDTTGYYADFGAPSALAKVISAGFLHDGTWSSFRGRRHGRPLDRDTTPAWRLVVCSDNHDQIGNRADGHRLASVVGLDQLKLAALVTLAAPATPMIFMGEEWGADTPWAFFTSHPEPELAEAVRRGRREEFAAMNWDLSSVPDPQDPATFSRSKLDWTEPENGDHGELLAFVRQLIGLRRTVPDLTLPWFPAATVRCSDADGWLVVERGRTVLAVNFADADVELELPAGGPLVEVGSVTATGGRVTLGKHSAVLVGP